MRLILLSLVLFASPLYAAEPKSKIAVAFDPPVVLTPKSGVAVYLPPPEVKAVEYIGLDGEEPFPVSLIGGTPTAFAFLTRGLPEKSYRFVGVASDAQGNLTRKQFVVQVGAPPVVVDPPKKPPVEVPSGTFYFLVVRADGPASPAFTKTMGDSAWATLVAGGHLVKDKTVTEAKAVGVVLPTDAPLPAVAILEENATSSKLLKVVALPTTSQGILDLPKGVK